MILCICSFLIFWLYNKVATILTIASEVQMEPNKGVVYAKWGKSKSVALSYELIDEDTDK